jgi:ABC-type multidrug transport system fused ATPase/permease subunit
MLKYIRWIWRNTTGIRLNIAAQILLGLLNVASALAMVWLSKMFIDETIRTGTDSDIWTMVALLVGTVVAGIVLRQICYYLGVKAKVRQSNGIRLRIYDRLMHLGSLTASRCTPPRWSPGSNRTSTRRRTA